MEDLGIFTSDMTSNLTRQAMTTCWEAAVSARSKVTSDTGECPQYEFAIMAEVYDGAIGKNPQACPISSVCLCAPEREQ